MMPSPSSVSPTQGAGWRPIAEAPRDGTEIELRFFIGELAFKTKAKWHNRAWNHFAGITSNIAPVEWRPVSPDLAPVANADSGEQKIKEFPYNPAHPVGTCAKCGGEMVHNVPRLGAGGGFVHKINASIVCPEMLPARTAVMPEGLIQSKAAPTPEEGKDLAGVEVTDAEWDIAYSKMQMLDDARQNNLRVKELALAIARHRAKAVRSALAEVRRQLSALQAQLDR